MSQAQWNRSTLGAYAPGAMRWRLLGMAAAGVAVGLAVAAVVMGSAASASAPEPAVRCAAVPAAGA